jgi:hypothetical protein
MNTIIYQNKDLEYRCIQLGNYPTSNFFRKCERYGLKIFCIIERGVIKEKSSDFQEHQYNIQAILQERAIPIETYLS